MALEKSLRRKATACGPLAGPRPGKGARSLLGQRRGKTQRSGTKVHLFLIRVYQQIFAGILSGAATGTGKVQGIQRADDGRERPCGCLFDLVIEQVYSETGMAG